MAEHSHDRAAVDALKQILEESKKDVPKIGYELFVSRYLPLLAAPPERDAAGKIRPRNLEPWLEIAMHPSNPVEVLNADGTVRFVVPPLVGTVNTQYASKGGGLHRIGNDAQDKSNTHPVYGERFLANALNNSLRDQTLASVSWATQWNAVLIEHGYPGLPGISTTPVSDKVTPTTPMEPDRLITDEDYDDL